MHLNLETALIASVLVSLVMAISLFVAWRTQTAERAALLWGLAQATWAIGLGLLVLRDTTTPFVSLYLANGFLLASSVLLWSGVAAFCKRPAPGPAGLALAGVFLIGFIWFTEVSPDITARIVIIRVLICIATLGAAAEFLRGCNGKTLVTRALAALSLLPSIGLLGSAAIMAALDWTATQPFSEHPVIALSAFGTVVSNMIWGLAVLLLLLRRLERAHLAVLEPYQALVEQSLVGTYLIRNGVFGYVNPAMARMLEYEPDEMIGKLGPLDIVVPEEQVRATAMMKARLSEEIQYTGAYTVTGKTRSGKIVILEVQGRRIMDADGPAIAGLLLDVTARIQAEATLRQSHDALERQVQARTADLTKYRLAIEQGPTGVIILNANTSLDYANDAFRALAEDDPGSILDLPDFTARLEMIRRGHKMWQGQLERCRKDGTPQWLSLTCTGIVNETGQTRWIVVTATDETLQTKAMQSLKTAKEAAEQANRMRTEFLANMGHELRTPLNAITGFSSLMEAEVFGALGTPQYRDYARDVRRAAERLGAVIEDLLDMAAANAGTLILEDNRIPVSDIVQSALKTASTSAEAASITLTPDAPPADVQPLIVRGDGRRLVQALGNILDNAICFTPTGGAVTLETGRLAGGGLSLIVTDTGIGMTDEQIRRCVEPFWQGDSTLSRRHEGTGLGIPLTAEIIRLHGGTLAMERATPTGLRVTLTIPGDRITTMAARPLPADDTEPADRP